MMWALTYTLAAIELFLRHLLRAQGLARLVMEVPRHAPQITGSLRASPSKHGSFEGSVARCVSEYLLQRE